MSEMQIDPLAIFQENKTGWATATNTVTARWASQFVGIVLPAIGGYPLSVKLVMQTNPDNVDEYAISVNVVECVPNLEGAPSTWGVVDHTVVEMNVEAGGMVEFPLSHAVREQDWGIVITAAEYGSNNLQALPESVKLVVEYEDKPQPTTYTFTTDRNDFIEGDTVVLEVLRDGVEIGYMRVVVG